MYLSFSYNEEYVNFIRSLECCKWDPNTKEWETPIRVLSDIIDEFSTNENITIKLIKENTPEVISDTSDHILRPFEHQKEGINYGLSHNKWLLLDPPGLGKTLQAIYIAESLKEKGEIEHCLIICGVNALKLNWQKEISQCSKYDSIIIGRKENSKGIVSYSSIKERAKQLKENINEFFVIINIESLRDQEVIKAITKGKNKFDMIVFDEMHMAKSPKSQQSKGLLKLKAKYQIGMTGTLIINNPLDAYLPLRWIEEENSTFSTFRDNYCILDERWHSNVVGYKNIDYLKDQIEHCSLRRRKNILNLPDKLVIPEFLEMDKDQIIFYKDIRQGVVKKCDKVFITEQSLLSLVTRLRQASVCPSILTTENISSVKIERAAELIKSITSQNEKVVIFSTFKQSLEELSKFIEVNYRVCTGDKPDEEISKNIDIFQNGDCQVLLCTLAKMSTGLTLTSASYMIFLDTPWTYAGFEQACDRIHRIGTSKNITIYSLIAQGTIDERVYKLVNDKKDISDYMMGEEISDVERLRYLLNV